MCVVLKVGGSLRGEGGHALISAIRWLQSVQVPVVIVHGGGPNISARLQAHNIVLPFQAGQRMTTPEAMVHVEDVLYNEINQQMVQELNLNGLPVVGVSGASGIVAVHPSAMNRTGTIQQVNTDAIASRLSAGQIPVIAPLGYDSTGLHYNINADVAAGALAGALAANRVVFCTDVNGIYADWETKTQLFDATVEQLQALLELGKMSDGMIPKVCAVLGAIGAGVPAAYVVNGRDVGSVMWAVGDDAGGGQRTVYGTRVILGEAG